jgi:hypothetical protein
MHFKTLGRYVAVRVLSVWLWILDELVCLISWPGECGGARLWVALRLEAGLARGEGLRDALTARIALGSHGYADGQPTEWKPWCDPSADPEMDVAVAKLRRDRAAYEAEELQLAGMLAAYPPVVGGVGPAGKLSNQQPLEYAPASRDNTTKAAS